MSDLCFNFDLNGRGANADIGGCVPLNPRHRPRLRHDDHFPDAPVDPRYLTSLRDIPGVMMINPEHEEVTFGYLKDFIDVGKHLGLPTACVPSYDGIPTFFSVDQNFLNSVGAGNIRDALRAAGVTQALGDIPVGARNDFSGEYHDYLVGTNAVGYGCERYRGR